VANNKSKKQLGIKREVVTTLLSKNGGTDPKNWKNGVEKENVQDPGLGKKGGRAREDKTCVFQTRMKH